MKNKIYEDELYEIILINKESEKANFDAKEACKIDECGIDFCSPEGCEDICSLIDFTG